MDGMPWIALDDSEGQPAAVTVHNYDGDSKEHLRLTVGEKVALKKQNTNWYFGHVWNATQRAGIFPKSHVEVIGQKQAKQIVVAEIQRTMPNWLSSIRQQLATLKGADLDQAMKSFMELRWISEQLESGKLTAAEAQHQSAVAVKIIDQCNAAYGLDLVLRNSQWEVINAFDYTFIAAYRQLKDVAKVVAPPAASQSADDKTPDADFGFLVTVESLDCDRQENLELCLSLHTAFDRQLRQTKWEAVTLLSESERRLRNEKAQLLPILFGRVNKLDACSGTSFHLMIRLYRHGRVDKSKMFKNAAAGKNPVAKRPYGCACLDLQKCLTSDEPVTLTGQLLPTEEHAGTQEIFEIAKKRAGDTGLGSVTLTARRLVPFEARRADTLTAWQLELLGEPKERDVAYLTLRNGEFLRNAKTADNNVEVGVQVCNSNGVPVEMGVLRRLNTLHGTPNWHTPEPYRSAVLYHASKPTWDELLTIDLDSIGEELHEHYVRFEVKHKSSKANDRILGYAVLPLHDTSQPMEKDLVPCALQPRDYDLSVQSKLPDKISPSFDWQLPRQTDEPRGKGGQAHRNFLQVRVRLSSTIVTFNWRVNCLMRLTADRVVAEHFNIDEKDAVSPCVFMPQLVKKALQVLELRGLRPEDDEKSMRLCGAALRCLRSLKYQSSFDEIGDFRRFLNECAPNPPNAFEALMRHLTLAIKSHMRNTSEQPQVSSVQYILCIAAHCAAHCELIGTEVVQRMFADFFQVAKDMAVEKEDFASQFLPGLYRESLGLLLELLDPVWLGRQLLGIVSAGRKSKQTLATLMFKINEFVTNEAFLRTELRLDLVHVIVGAVGDFLRIKVVPFEVNKSANLIGSVFRWFNGLLCHLCEQPEAEVKKEVNFICWESNMLRQLVQASVVTAFNDPYADMKRSSADSKTVAALVAAVIACLELANRRSQFDTWQNLFTANVVRLNCWERFGVKLQDNDNATKVDLYDQVSELIDLFMALFREIDDRYQGCHDIRLMESRIIVQTLRIIEEKLVGAFTNPISIELTSKLFECLFEFIGQPHLQHEEFDLDKRERHLTICKTDLRLEAFAVVEDLWRHMDADDQQTLRNCLVLPLVQVSLQRDRKLRQQCAKQLAELIACECKSNPKYPGMTNELVFVLDLVVEERGSEEFVKNFLELFNEELTVKNLPNTHVLIKHLRCLTRLLLEYRTLTADALPESRMFAIYNLYKFFKDINKEEMCNRYLYKLCQLHENAENWAEAGCVLLLQAKYLNWDTSDLTVDRNALQEKYRNCKNQGDLKERLIWDAIAYFEKGKLFHKAKQQAELLWEYYKNTLVDYGKERRVLEKIASLCSLITDCREVHIGNAYYFIHFGSEFPDFLRNNTFVYLGVNNNQLVNVIQYFETLFPEAKVPQGGNISLPTGNMIKIKNLTVVPNPPNPNATFDQLHYYQNNELDLFELHTMTERTEDVTRKEICVDEFRTEEAFPSVLRLLPAKHVKSYTQSPVQTAIRDNEKMNEKLRYGIYQLKTHRINTAQGLFGQFMGNICSTVGGGVRTYEKFFVEDLNSEETGLTRDQQKLADVIMEQLSLSVEALKVCSEFDSSLEISQQLTIVREVIQAFEGCTGLQLSELGTRTLDKLGGNTVRSRTLLPNTGFNTLKLQKQQPIHQSQIFNSEFRQSQADVRQTQLDEPVPAPPPRRPRRVVED